MHELNVELAPYTPRRSTQGRRAEATTALPDARTSAGLEKQPLLHRPHTPPQRYQQASPTRGRCLPGALFVRSAACRRGRPEPGPTAAGATVQLVAGRPLRQAAYMPLAPAPSGAFLSYEAGVSFPAPATLAVSSRPMQALAATPGQRRGFHRPMARPPASQPGAERSAARDGRRRGTGAEAGEQRC